MARLLLALLVVVLSVTVRAADAKPWKQRAKPSLTTLPSKEQLVQLPSYRYVNMTGAEALAELDRRRVPYQRAAKLHGVTTPVRLTAKLHGVDIHSALPADKRASSHFEILDARLALALDDFAALLERHDIVELVHYTMYRPNGRKPGTADPPAKAAPPAKEGAGKPVKHKSKRKPALGKKGALGDKDKSTATRGTKKKKSAPVKGKRAKARSKRPAPNAKAKPPAEPAPKSSWAPPGYRHPAGLAIDVGGLRKRDGRWLSVAYHFGGKVGSRTCGPLARTPMSARARELWSVVCEAADLGIFTYVLTPNYDVAHADHLHMEIRPDTPWLLFH